MTKLLEGNTAIIAKTPYIQGFSRKSHNISDGQKRVNSGAFRYFLVQFSANFQQILD